jgi:hypothetical protein
MAETLEEKLASVEQELSTYHAHTPIEAVERTLSLRNAIAWLIEHCERKRLASEEATRKEQEGRQERKRLYDERRRTDPQFRAQEEQRERMEQREKERKQRLQKIEQDMRREPQPHKKHPFNS